MVMMFREHDPNKLFANVKAARLAEQELAEEAAEETAEETAEEAAEETADPEQE
jgi:hypothetical protein